MFPRGWLHQTSLRSFFGREEIERELDEELLYHVDRATQRNIERGMSATEARRAAMLAMGGLEQVKEECRDVRRVRLLEEVLQDVAYGWRMMRKFPAFTCVAIALLALAIAANAMVLSLISALLLRPLPYPDSHQLVLLWERFAAQRLERVPFSAAEFTELTPTTSFESLAAFTHTEFNLAGEGTPERIQGLGVSANLFSVLKADAVAGRVFQANEKNVIVISERLWQRRFASDPAIVGSQLSLNGRPRVVIGIMPAAFRFPLPLFNIRGQFAGSAEIWEPINFTRDQVTDRGRRIYNVIARLRSGVTAREANAELEKLSADWKRRYPASYSRNGFSLSAYHLKEQLVGHMQVPLLILQGAVFLLLIIAGANLAAMLLARAGVREHETAVRIALGAGISRLVRQRLTEMLTLSVLAGGAGLALSWIALFLLRSFGAQTIPRLSEVDLDKMIVLVMLGLSAIGGALLGLVPTAKGGVRRSIADNLKHGGRGLIQGRRRTRLRNTFVVTETALALLLLIGAGSLAGSFVRLRNVDPGFKAENILTTEISLPTVSYPTEEAIANFFANAAQKVAAISGVDRAAFTSLLPLSGATRDAAFTIEGASFIPSPDEEIRMITPDYFEVLETPLVEGRFFTTSDKSDSQLVVIVNQALAERYWPGGDSLGKRISLNESSDKWMTIVGIVANIRHRGLDEPVKPELYLPHSQSPYQTMVLVARSALPARELISAIRRQVFSIDPALPVAKVRSLERVVADSIASRRITVLLVGMFAGIAVLFVSTGIYGVMASIVLERRQEIAVRMALGARSGHIFLRMARLGTKLLLYGAAIGVTIALILVSIWAPSFRNVATFDIGTILGALIILSLVCCLAMYVATRRAAHADLMVTLRES